MLPNWNFIRAPFATSPCTFLTMSLPYIQADYTSLNILKKGMHTKHNSQVWLVNER